MRLSANFTTEEMTLSREAELSGLKNCPNERQIEALRRLCVNVLQPLRDRVQRPIIVTSGFRSVTINRRLGGVARSQHTRGEAADFVAHGLAVADTVDLLRAMRLPFDQLIDEFGRWIHVSHSFAGGNRGEVLTARLEGGRRVYRRLA